jgi:hypothetical protein
VLAGYGGLRDVFNFATPAGKAEFGAGQEDIGKASAYWSKFLSGDRATMEQAVAPETNAVLSQADAAKREQASIGTARGGGTAGANQQVQDASMAKIDNLLFSARPAAAKAEESIGGTELSAALRALGLGESAASDLTGHAITSRMDSYKINKDTQNSIKQVVADLAAVAFA